MIIEDEKKVCVLCSNCTDETNVKLSCQGCLRSDSPKEHMILKNVQTIQVEVAVLESKIELLNKLKGLLQHQAGLFR